VLGGKSEGVDRAKLAVRRILDEFSMALTGFGLADFREAMKRLPVSPGSFIAPSD